LNQSPENNTNEQKVSFEFDYYLKAFRAIENEAESLKFFDGHLAVLTEYGIQNLNTSRPAWLTNPDVYVINIYDRAGDVVGGLRVHLFLGHTELPIMNAIMELDSRIQTIIESSLPKGTAEVCGLWSARKVFGRGLSPVVGMSSVVLVKLLGFDDFYCFSAPYTEKMIRSHGCIPLQSIGNNGRFNYPTEEFVSVVLHNPSISKLEYADPYIAQRIRSLIANPEQIHEEPSPRGQIKIKFDLRVRR
jgi:hypothetical protein